MQRLDEIAESIHQSFETRTAARDRALSQARTLTRHCAHAIRALHREELDLAQTHLEEARALVDSLTINLNEYPDLYFAGYTQDALKEFAEANLVFALVYDRQIPTPEELGLVPATYLQGLSEAVGELRRRILDLLLQTKFSDTIRLLNAMDDIYAVLVTMDYPDAITGGLRRLTDIARSIIERTRGDVTMSLRQEELEQSLREMEKKLAEASEPLEDNPGI